MRYYIAILMEQDNQQPQDMWEDTDPVEGGPNPPTPPQPAPQPIPEQNTTPEPQPMPAPVPPMAPMAPLPVMPTPTPSAPTPEVNPPSRGRGNGWMWIVVVLLVLVAGGLFAWQNWNSWFPPVAQEQEEENENIVGSSDVEWQNPVRVADLRLYSPEYPPEEPSHTYRKVGEFTSGKYEGGDLIVLTVVPEGPAFYDNFFRFVAEEDGNMVLLVNNSDESYEGDGLDRSAFTIDASYMISDLKFPTELANPNDTNQPLIMDEFASNAWFADKKEIKEVYSDPMWGAVYTDINTQSIPPKINDPSNQFTKGGFYMKAPDGTIRQYKLKIPFMPEENITTGITWKDKSKNGYDYNPTEVGGCGALNYASVMPATLASDLQEAGTVAYGSSDDTIYELKDKNHVLLKNVYDQYVAFGNEGASYESFTKSHPLFFWKDSFGRLIKFQSSQFMPAAECGKPVIYLYPEKETKVSVKVAPQGGMSYSDPAYGNGWEVIAKPTGELTETKSGKQFPYLFWEGKGGLYQTPDKGWVVPQSEVEKTITEKLTAYGLNGKEIADFNEFWLPRMQEAKYYFITFLGTSEMNRLAPLTISPKPDTVIRVLMDFVPLDKPKAVADYPIRTLPRKGFTVIEWGGVLK